MRLHLPRRRGATWLERMVALILFGVFLAAFLDRVSYYQEHAEKMEMELTVRNMRTGLRYKIADLIMNNRLPEMATLADENPINWLEQKPANYLGEFDGAPAEASSGSWYFDRRNRQLVYTINHRRHFEPSDGQDFSVRYQAVRRISPAQTRNSAQEAWVSLAPVRDFRWQP